MRPAKAERRPGSVVEIALGWAAHQEDRIHPAARAFQDRNELSHSPPARHGHARLRVHAKHVLAEVSRGNVDPARPIADDRPLGDREVVEQPSSVEPGRDVLERRVVEAVGIVVLGAEPDPDDELAAASAPPRGFPTTRASGSRGSRRIRPYAHCSSGSRTDWRRSRNRRPGRSRRTRRP